MSRGRLHSNFARALSALALVVSAQWAYGAELRAVRLWDSPDYTRAVFDLSGPLGYKIFSLSNPSRVVLDLKASSLGDKFDAPSAQGLVVGMRSGQPGPKDLRIVIDLNAGARPKSFLLAPAEGKGHRLVVDLYPASSTAPKVVMSAETAAPSGQRDVVIAVDAGHGGEDPGSLGATGTYEKNVTLAIAKLLARAIDNEPGMTAILVRDGDYYIPHKQRYEKARKGKADLFISIHADAFTNRSAAGSSVYMLSQRGATSEAARWLADSENASDLVGGVSLDDKDNDLAAVLLDLSQGATLGASDAVANSVLSSLRGLGRVHQREVQRANFIVLRSPDVPSILVETAFISNPAEERRLVSPMHQQRLANAILDGVRNYFNGAPPVGTWIAAHRRAPSQHIVARGESLSLIAQRHGVSVSRLRSVNNRQSDIVRVGEVLRLPTET